MLDCSGTGTGFLLAGCSYGTAAAAEETVSGTTVGADADARADAGAGDLA